MKYKFTVDHIPNSFLRANPAMHPSHPEYLKAIITTVYELAYGEDVAMQTAQESLALSIEADDQYVLGITGARLE